MTTTLKAARQSATMPRRSEAIMTAYAQDEHEIINQNATPDNPGTRMVCDLCSEFSGSCEDDAFIVELLNGTTAHICSACLDAIEAAK